jgi:hypothetical protein
MLLDGIRTVIIGLCELSRKPFSSYRLSVFQVMPVHRLPQRRPGDFAQRRDRNAIHIERSEK